MTLSFFVRGVNTDFVCAELFQWLGLIFESRELNCSSSDATLDIEDNAIRNEIYVDRAVGRRVYPWQATYGGNTNKFKSF